MQVPLRNHNKLPSITKAPLKTSIIEKVKAMKAKKETAGDKAKNTKWRQKSEQFRNAMKAAKGGAVIENLAEQYDDRK